MLNMPLPLSDASSTLTVTTLTEVRTVEEMWIPSTPVSKSTNTNKRNPRGTFSQLRLQLLLLATTVGLSVFRARQSVDTVRVLMQTFWVKDDLNFSYSSIPQFIAAELTVTPTSTNTSIQTNLTVTSSTRKSTLEMSPLPPPPFTMNGTGGIVFFLHIPKTGGTTMRDFLKKNANQLHIVRNSGGWKRVVPMVDILVRNGTQGQIVAIETHDQNVPPYHKLSHKIREWKRTAAQYNVPFFVATLLRESVSMQISSFNYYYVASWKKLANDTVADFLDTMLGNPICSFLHNGGMFFDNLDRKHPEIRARRNKLNSELQKQHCDLVYELLLEDMDWVGTTDRLETETLPLFRYLFHRNNTAGAKGHANEMRQVRMHLDRLEESDVARVKQSTEWDQEWYHKTQEIFKFKMWRDHIGPEFFLSTE